jgi:aryl-alcohol dehydrogenase-like predicted oxidoreductase
MEFRSLGSSGLQVSLVGLGCNNFGRRCDAEQTRAVVHRALDEGVNFFDTADMYGERGGSEELLGKALGSRRDDIVLATKFGAPMGDAPDQRGASRRWIQRALEASLRRLGTDYIDLYQLHFPDASTPQEETLRALDDLVRAGKVRYLGCSNFASWQLVDALWISRDSGLSSYVSAQNLYNLLDRRIERELVPACREFGVGVLPYFPLASGFLTGKYRAGQAPPDGTRLAGAGPMADRILTEQNFERLAALETFARERGRGLLELAVGWLASQPVVSSVISGATRPDQVTANVAAAAWRLSAEELAEVHRLSRRSA